MLASQRKRKLPLDVKFWTLELTDTKAVDFYAVYPLHPDEMQFKLENGMDALLSTVQMPGGIPVGSLAIGKAGATNAGWLAAGILATSDEGLASKLKAHRQTMAEKVMAKSAAAQDKLPGLIG